MLTVPVELLLAIVAPFDRNGRMMSLLAVHFPVVVSVAPLPAASHRLPLVWTRPPMLKFAPAKKLRSDSENMMN